MKKQDIYLGNLMKCLNFERYMNDGERSIQYCAGDIVEKAGLGDYGMIIPNVELIYNDILLVKNNYYYYNWIPIYCNIIDRILFDLGINWNVLSIIPGCDGDLYLDSESIRPFYSDHLEENIKVKTLIRDYIKNK